MKSRTRSSAPPFIKKKRGQIHISFGMIFSIILIIIFIAFAIYAIKAFLGFQDSIKMNTFYDNLQNDVNTVWNVAASSKPYSYNLPTSIQQTCFTNSGNSDLVLFGSNGAPQGTHAINNLNITAMTSSGDLCFNVTKGKLSFVLHKNFGETLVTIIK